MPRACVPCRRPALVGRCPRQELADQGNAVLAPDYPAEARVYRDLARTDPVHHADAAVKWTQQAINAFGPLNVRSTVLNEVGLCSALTLAGEPDRAINVGATVIGHGHQLTSHRINDRIRNLTRDIPADTSHSGLADFRHQISRIEPAAA